MLSCSFLHMHPEDERSVLKVIEGFQLTDCSPGFAILILRPFSESIRYIYKQQKFTEEFLWLENFRKL